MRFLQSSRLSHFKIDYDNNLYLIMMKRMQTWGFVALVVLLIGCEGAAEKLKEEMLPTAGGEIGEMILVIDSTQWKGEIGREIKEAFRAPMIGLPQDEPMFSVNKVNPRKLNNLLKSATNMVFVMTLDSKTEESRTIRRYFTNQSLNKIQQDTSLWMTIRNDEFAKGQVALYLFAKDEATLVRKLDENMGRLRAFFESVEQKRIKKKLYASRATEAEKAILESQGVSLQVPFGWDLAKNLPNFSWIRFLEVDREMDIFIYQQPYTSQSVFNDLPGLRDNITSQFLRDSEKPELYIMRQDIVPVFQEAVNFQGNYAKKARGLWKISDNSGGGPFISYTIVDEASQKLFYIEGYVYAPAGRKKNFVREVDAILSTFKTSN